MKQIVSVSLDADVVEKIKNLAENCDRSFSQYMNLVLKRHIEEAEKENAKPGDKA